MLGMLISAALSLAGTQAALASPQTIVPLAPTIIRGDRQGLPDLRDAKRPCTRHVGETTISFTWGRDRRMAVRFEEDRPYFGAVYDHDRDGRIDHLVYPIGLLPFGPEHDFRYGFWQALDTDHDGMVDTLVTPAAPKSQNQGFSGWAVVTGASATGSLVCTLIDAAGKVIEPCTKTEKGLEGATASAMFRPSQASDIASLWTEMQQAEHECGFTAIDLPP